MTESQEPAKDYAALRKEFAEWLMNPFRGTQSVWANEHGVNEATLSKWKADPEFAKLLQNWRERAKVAIPSMLQAVIARVIDKGDPIAFRAVMEALGESKLEVDMNLAAPFLDLQKRLIAIRQQQAAEAEQPRQN